ncbi:MAG TPA: SGNH/GDSL hydrolase family protein, partial [Candidatus Nitrosotenuis sp.]|nr:SGNH/GDSL hydrolase family protein [Candidatus Nitrosotenuis sp.]
MDLLEKLRAAKPKHFRLKLLLSVVSLALSLVLLEGLEWWLDVADPPIFSSHPAYGYLMQPNQSVATRGKRFRINNAGLRGGDIVMPKPQGVFRIAFLGDSITYGGGSIRDEDLFVNRIVKSLDPITRPQLEAVNISAPGWGLANMAGFVNSVGLFDADLLIWVISAPDLRRPFTRLEEHGFLQQKPSSRVLYAIRTSYIRIFQAIQSNKRRSSAPRQNSGNLNSNIRVLRTMLAQLTGKGLAVAVVLVPGAS